MKHGIDMLDAATLLFLASVIVILLIGAMK